MGDSGQVRLFVALTVPEGVKAKMEEVQAKLRRGAPERAVRWARREQFHLTLRFLGDVAAARVEALGEALRGACRGFGALHLRAQGVGFFPNQRYPKVAWVGVRDAAEQLPRLQQVVEAATEAFTTEKKEERFTGHLTLARIKGIRREEAEALGQAAAEMADRLFGQWTAYRIELMRSDLSPQGARHTGLGSFALTDLPSNPA